MLFLKLIKESLFSAVSSLTTNRVRTFLSLLGITIGIFAIISVFTVVDSLERKIRESIESLGSNVIYIQKWPWEFSNDYPWWKYINRPLPNLNEYEEIKRRSEKAEASALMISTSRTVQYGGNSADNAVIIAASHEYEDIRTFDIEKGRYFSPIESVKGRPTAIIGVDIAKALFSKQNPTGKIIKLAGFKLMVVGVFKKEGSSMFNNSVDNQVLIPINYARNIIDLRSDFLDPMIMVRAKAGISTLELTDELRGIMRSIRKLKPLEEDDFALNRASMISQGFDQLFKVVDLSGFFIGILSILVGGFGIANIMFVSVKERTKIIGIQKALGAKRFFILNQFLYEAIILSLIGGIVGLLLIFTGTVFIRYYTDLEIALSANNIILGILISGVVGLLSGLIPAYAAAKLDPVKAMGSN
ncbi:MAG: ABC transporter permease [Bacteroidia bacterium]|nr:ABC transporter permease [Bacteroidia bacterium]